MATSPADDHHAEQHAHGGHPDAHAHAAHAHHEHDASIN